LVVIDGNVGLTCANVFESVGRGLQPLALLPRICHARAPSFPNLPTALVSTEHSLRVLSPTCDHALAEQADLAFKRHWTGGLGHDADLRRLGLSYIVGHLP
jgi:hypothetical protein